MKSISPGSKSIAKNRIHSLMFNFFKNLTWYPPAETRIPWSAILSAFTRPSGNFTKSLCNYLGVDHCILGESARALLFKLLETLKRQDGGQRDEVLIPGYTCYSVAAAVAKADLKIAVYDLDPKTIHADLDSIKKAISEKTLAVVTQHLFGMLTPIDELKGIAHKSGVYLIEDAAQAFGKVDGGKLPGTMGDFGIFSFGRGKPLPIGGGGALVSHDHLDVLDGIKLNSQGNGYNQTVVSAATQIISKPAFYWIPEMLPLGLGQTVFDPDFHIKGIPNAIETMLVKALPILDELNTHRRQLSCVYSNCLADNCLINTKNTEQTSIIRFPVMLPDTILMKGLKRLGVRRRYPKAISDESSIKPYLKTNKEPTPGAAEIAEQLFTLPTHMGINDNLARQISVAVQKY
jgi:dTDP-4-amino-4,6-dideoxygalactose transaminase